MIRISQLRGVVGVAVKPAVIYVMGKSRFPQWLKGRKNEIETISEIS